MIQTTFNPISSGATGMFGGQVVRYIRNGREIIAKAPPKRPGKGTPGQERTRGDFRQAAAWSEKVRTTETLREKYQAFMGNGKNVHNLAIADYLVAPVIHSVKVDAGRVFVHATDNLQVNEVSVFIYAPSGELLEEGLATEGKADLWTYMPVAAIRPEYAIVVTARDIPGNECRYETEVPWEGVTCPPKGVYRQRRGSINLPSYPPGIPPEYSPFPRGRPC